MNVQYEANIVDPRSRGPCDSSEPAPPAITEQAVFAVHDALQRAVTRLAERHGYSAAETLVARDIARGFSRRQIADRRGRSERTIQSQIRTLLMKSDARDTSTLRAHILEVALSVSVSGFARLQRQVQAFGIRRLRLRQCSERPPVSAPAMHRHRDTA